MAATLICHKPAIYINTSTNIRSSPSDAHFGCWGMPIYKNIVFHASHMVKSIWHRLFGLNIRMLHNGRLPLKVVLLLREDNMAHIFCRYTRSWYVTYRLFPPRPCHFPTATLRPFGDWCFLNNITTSITHIYTCIFVTYYHVIIPPVSVIE